MFHLSPDFEAFKTICSDGSITSRKNGHDRRAAPSPHDASAGVRHTFAIVCCVVHTDRASVCGASTSVGCAIRSIYNRSILSGVVSGFHELTSCLVFICKRVSPTVAIDPLAPVSIQWFETAINVSTAPRGFLLSSGQHDFFGSAPVRSDSRLDFPHTPQITHNKEG